MGKRNENENKKVIKNLSSSVCTVVDRAPLGSGARAAVISTCLSPNCHLWVELVGSLLCFN